ncbi:MAG TPA: DEAD/DEAH box helicase [Candidatus Saccharimonadia bacterium]|nr:DEAD/DEAH box helicase [Candidatus Saccharimonadia bacterium]
MGPQPKYIDPARYVRKALPSLEPEQKIAITHSFTEFGLNEQLMHNVTSHGYVTPTPIQDQAIPYMMQGKDVVGIANTGTGKTAAFLLPLMNKVIEQPNEGVLIIVPTRELASQIADEFKVFVRGLPISMTLCVGGVNLNPQIWALEKNPHFVIGTPGRLKDLIGRKALDTSKFANIVLDEVDRMLDIGFLHDIRDIVSQLPKPRHSYFFSATMTRDVDSIMRSFLTDPVTVTVKSQEAANLIDQDVIRVQVGKNKIQVLADLLSQPDFEKVIVFGRTKHGINSLEVALSSMGLRVSAIHGNKSQNARQHALDMFKRGRVKALLATDVAARGIDIDGVTHVINFDEPNSYEDYTHRIGRTGRAGKVGKALTFVM